jgi:hypothetical protein
MGQEGMAPSYLRTFDENHVRFPGRETPGGQAEKSFSTPYLILDFSFPITLQRLGAHSMGAPGGLE